MTFEPRPKGSEGASRANIWGQIVPSQGNSKDKGPEVRTCLPCSGTVGRLVREELGERGDVGGGKVREEGRGADGVGPS